MGTTHGDSRDEHIVGDVVKVTSVLQPGTSHADVVRRALAMDLEEYESFFNVLPIPLGKWSQKLESTAARRKRQQQQKH